MNGGTCILQNFLMSIKRVAKASNVKNKGGKTKYKPYVSKAIYEANKKSDRDKDLIACER
ncbi:excalibur calcium-binding domain-containing protein [Fictibacillus sp. 5RED26]|nr:excalibur calcium-binding domain-containing protein [Fictibacillus sp. 5RED26]